MVRAGAVRVRGVAAGSVHVSVLLTEGLVVASHARLEFVEAHPERHDVRRGQAHQLIDEPFVGADRGATPDGPEADLNALDALASRTREGCRHDRPGHVSPAALAKRRVKASARQYSTHPRPARDAAV